MIIYIKETNRFVNTKDIPSWVKDRYGIKTTNEKVRNILPIASVLYVDKGIVSAENNF